MSSNPADGAALQPTKGVFRQLRDNPYVFGLSAVSETISLKKANVS